MTWRPGDAPPFPLVAPITRRAFYTVRCPVAGCRASPFEGCVGPDGRPLVGAFGATNNVHRARAVKWRLVMGLAL